MLTCKCATLREVQCVYEPRCTGSRGGWLRWHCRGLCCPLHKQMPCRLHSRPNCYHHTVWCDKISIETSIETSVLVLFVTDSQRREGVASWMMVLRLTLPLPPPTSPHPPLSPPESARHPTSLCARPPLPCLLMGCPVVTGSD